MPYGQKESSDQKFAVKADETDEMLAVFEFPATYDLGAVLDQKWARLPSTRGRKLDFDGAACVAILVTCRIKGSRAGASRILQSRDNWQQAAARYEAMTGRPLPARPPSEDTIDYIQAKVAKTPGLLDALEARFSKLAVAQARLHGNLLPDQQPRWLEADEAHTVYGDGTIFKPASDVSTITHPATGEKVFLGSRATEAKRVRMQQFLTDLSKDGKEHARGVNHVSLHTWTINGRVVLGVGYATGAELWPALDLLDTVTELTGDGVHKVVYDRVITGWPVEYLAATHRVMTVNKNVASSVTDDTRDTDNPED